MAKRNKKTIAGAMKLAYENDGKIEEVSSVVSKVVDGTIPVGEVRDVKVNGNSVVTSDKIASLTFSEGLTFDGSLIRLSDNGLSETTQKNKPMALQDSISILVFENGIAKTIKSSELDYSRIRRNRGSLRNGDYLFEVKEG